MRLGSWIRRAFVFGLLMLLILAVLLPTRLNGDVPVRAKANADVRLIADAVRLYQLTHHRLPTWDELAAEDHADGYLRDLRDPWDHRYQLEPGGTADVLLVRCLGPDGVANTGDDVVATVR